MNSENKQILYSFRGKNTVEVVDQGNVRSLYFKNSVVQSRLLHQHPEKLVLKYTRYMMAAALLANPEPLEVLVIGVGAGAMLHYLHHHRKNTRIDGVDKSEQILKIARGYFSIPENNKVTIHCDDGLSFLGNPRKSEGYDIIFVDAFNDDGMARNIYSEEFFRLARKQLSAQGVLCCNLWSGNQEVLTKVKKAIQKHSESCVYIPVRKRENIVAVIFQTPVPWKILCPEKEKLQQLSRRYEINFMEVSAAMRKHNMRIAEHLQHWFN